MIVKIPPTQDNLQFVAYNVAMSSETNDFTFSELQLKLKDFGFLFEDKDLLKLVYTWCDVGAIYEHLGCYKIRKRWLTN